jgi:hypothetical protein
MQGPCDPIVVNKEGEAIKPGSTACQEGSEIFYEQIHLICDGRMRGASVSPTHKAMFCHCGLRVVYPKTCKTYGDLRAHFATRLKNAKKRPAHE